MLRHIKTVLAILLLAILWAVESWRPFFDPGPKRHRHALRNLALTLGNTLVLTFTLGWLTIAVTDAVATRRIGLLHILPDDHLPRLVVALLLFDAWMYFWHRSNHALPLLWRFHRTHHSDDRMDVTTSSRFHIGELILSTLARLLVIPLLGLALWHLLLYECLALTVTYIHHANVSFGRADRWLRWLMVTPDMHKVHHSRYRPETDSNYGTILPLWDWLAGTYRMVADPIHLRLGLDSLADDRWQTLEGMLRTPLAPLDEPDAPTCTPEAR